MSRAKAIEAFCKMCIYDRHQPGNWREQVEKCLAKACPLYEYRPLPDRRALVQNGPNFAPISRGAA
jgi:hypothetical protein